MSAGDFIVGYLFGRRGVKRWTGRERTRPNMPSGPWRAAALLCSAAGALVAWLLARDADALGWRLIAGAVLGFAGGLYVVESIWERRVRGRDAGSTGHEADG